MVIADDHSNLRRYAVVIFLRPMAVRDEGRLIDSPHERQSLDINGLLSRQAARASDDNVLAR